MTNQPSIDSFHMNKVRRDAYRNWINDRIFAFPASSWCAVSFTLRQGRRSDGNFEKLTSAKCEEAIDDFLHQLNQRVYRNAYRRNAKRLSCVPAIETGLMGRLHIHLLLQIPDYMADHRYTFSDQIQQVWRKSRWAMGQTNIQFCEEVEAGAIGWVNYITKNYVGNDESLSLIHMHLPGTSNSVH